MALTLVLCTNVVSLMNWDAIGAIGEVVGAVAVVVTLFYLTIQLRQNTAQVKHSGVATEIASYQDLIGRINDLNAIRISDPDLTDLILRGQVDPDALTENERVRYGTWVLSLLRHGDMAYFLYERGTIDRERAVATLGPLLPALDTDGFERVWERVKSGGAFTPGYVEFLESVREARHIS